MEGPKLSHSNNNKKKKSSPRTSKINVNHNQEKLEVRKKDNVKEENVSYKDKSETFVQDLSNLQQIESQLNSMLL